VANINIKLSQSAVDAQSTAGDSSMLGGSVGEVLDGLAVIDSLLTQGYPTASTWSLTGATLKMTFADGAVLTFTGASFDTPGAAAGGITATGYQFSAGCLVTAAHNGTLHYNYSTSGASISLQPSPQGQSINSFDLATHLPSSSPLYDADMGNVDLLVAGAVNIAASGAVTGNVTKITASAEKYLASEVIDGNFQLSGNYLSAGLETSHIAASGTLTGFNDTYRDGSYLSVTNISTQINAGEAFATSMFGQAARFGGDDTINIELPGHLYADFLMAAGAGNDQISIKGGGGRLHVDAGDGNDRITVLGDAHRVDGGAGPDVLSLPGARASYQLGHPASGFTITDGAGAVTSLANVERIAFADAALALDVGGSGGQAYRLYQAAFNRAPDSGGLGFQMWAMDTVGWSLTQVANGFIESPEFKATYGSLSNRDFVIQLYANVLHRAPDAGGLKFHVDLLDAGTVTRAQDLVGFSESPENQAALIGVIGNGFVYIPHA
jgi:hypothetical protein